MGAAEDARAKDKYGDTPLFIACTGSHLNVARWLFEVGAGEDIHTKSNYLDKPLGATSGIMQIFATARHSTV